MTKTLPILIIAVLGLTIFSCIKEKTDLCDASIGYHPLTEIVEPYKFKEGSYWVFENDTTGVLDSIVVTSIENGYYWSPPPVHCQRGYKYQYYKINLKSFATSLTYNDYVTQDYIKRNGGGDYGQYGQPVLMISPLSDSGAGFNGMLIIANLPSMTINGNDFNNIDIVKITAANQYQPEFTYDTYLYYTSTVGLIKKETDLGNGTIESWSIKRWKVIK